MQLTAGSWGTPGSSYRICLPVDSSELTGSVEVSGTGTARVAATLASDPSGSVTAGLNHIYEPALLTSVSTLRYLAWEVRLDLTASRVLTADLQLRWARAHVEITRRGSQLVFDGAVIGRGIWRPLIPLLVRFWVRQESIDPDGDELWADVCEAISAAVQGAPSTVSGVDEPTERGVDEPTESGVDDPTESEDPWWTQVTDDDLDLRYLRSPISLFMHLGRRLS